jgi:curved DNA-binding protein CbpA
MKDYYTILDIGEGASQEDIRDRWAELTKLNHPDLTEGSGTDEKIKAINEAYQVLKDPGSRFEYDLERNVKISMLQKRADYRQRRASRKKKMILSSSILVVFLVVSLLLFLSKPSRVSKGPSRAIISPPMKVAGLQKIEEPKKPEKPVEVAKVIPQEPAKVLSPITAKAAEPRKPEEAKKPEKPVEVAKVIPREPAKVISSGTPKTIEPRKPGETKKPEKPFEVAKVIPREPAKVISPETPKAIEPRKVEETKKPEKPAEVAKAIPKEPAKVVSSETPKAIEPRKAEETKKPEKPVEVAKAIPQEPAKVVSPETPKPAETRKPEEAKKTEIAEKPVEVAKAAPQPPTPLPPPPPPSFASEGEVKKFFASYADQYSRKNIDGFISFFSPKAVQNQKDGYKDIKKIVSNFFDQNEDLQYQLIIQEIGPHQKGLEVKARYELQGVLKKGKEWRVWRGQIRWVLTKEDGAFKILSLDYQPQQSGK